MPGCTPRSPDKKENLLDFEFTSLSHPGVVAQTPSLLCSAVDQIALLRGGITPLYSFYCPLVSGERSVFVPPTRVYRRPGLAVWTALSQGKPVPAAVDAGRLRLEQLIGGDLQNAKRVQSRATMHVI